MSHIKRITTKQISDLVTNFIKFEPKTDIFLFDISELNNSFLDENTIKTIIAKYSKSSIAINSIFAIIKDAAKYTDWVKKESILSSLVSNIKRKLVEIGDPNPKETANYIVNELINSI